MSFKDKITSHLPGHKHQDNNANGIPDRLERPGMGRPGMATGTGFATGAPLVGGATILPGSTQNIATTTYTQGANGMPIGGNVLNDQTVTSQTIYREPALVQTTPLAVQQPAMDLNRNGIPDNLEQGFGFIGSVPTNQASSVSVSEAPTIVQKIEKPAVVHEVYKTEEVVQIQPVIERERDQLDVYEVIQPMREREVVATEVRQLNLPAQTRATIVEDNSAFIASRSAPSDFSTREVAATRSQVVQNAPIVHETIVHKVVEEVQPVIYKEIDRPVLVKETLPIYEKVVEAPHSHKTVLPMRDLGTTRSMATTTTMVQPAPQATVYQTTGLQSGLHSQGIIAPQQGFAQQPLQQGFAQPLQGQTLVGQQGFATGGLNDFNRNGIPDSLERNQGLMGQQGFAEQGFAQQGFAQQPLQGQSMGQQGFAQQPMQGQGFSQPLGMAKLGDMNGNGIPDALESRIGAAALNRRI